MMYFSLAVHTGAYLTVVLFYRKKNDKRTTHHRSDKLYYNFKFQARLKAKRKNILTKGGPPPYFVYDKTGMIKLRVTSIYIL